jgi:hypothetical protein
MSTSRMQRCTQGATIAWRGSVVVLALTSACNAPDPLPSTGGASLDEGPCGHGLFVITSDYQSTSTAIVDWSGIVHSARLIGSGSSAPGLGAALSGDVVAPTERVESGRIVLIDRFPAGVLSFVDPETAEVLHQTSLGTGFAANPQDYLELGGGVAYVSRYESNASPGAEAFDEGSDLLILDDDGRRIAGRVDLSGALEGADPELLPRPSRMLRLDESVVVLLSAYSRSFTLSGDARLALVDPMTHTVTGWAALPGARGCSALARSPSGARIAVGCSGSFGGTSTPTLDDAGVVVLRRDGADFVEEARFVAAEVLGDPPGFSLAFASERHVVVPSFGRLATSGEAARDDRLLELDLETGSVRELLRSEREPFTIGEVRCGAACGACFVTDADRGRVVRFSITPGGLASPRSLELGDGVGLPPRYLGGY